MADGGGLENRCGGNLTVGSNPTLSARVRLCGRGPAVSSRRLLASPGARVQLSAVLCWRRPLVAGYTRDGNQVRFRRSPGARKRVPGCSQDPLTIFNCQGYGQRQGPLAVGWLS